ncbi:MAG: Bro-N domain-containing protein [Deltaproteobacteria bacterium]|nr:Bro-N domain-containing protein [Deltaproteobacteria bacterium]
METGKDKLIPFESPEFGSVRVVLDDKGDPWFVAADVCRALGVGNASKALMALDEDEKGITTSNTLGGSQQMAIVSEPGLYSLILRSRKPAAKAFKRWVTHEVIPAVRSKGRYELPGLKQEVGLPTVEHMARYERILQAQGFFALAKSSFLTETAAHGYNARGLSILMGKPESSFLALVPTDGSEHWLTPTELAERLSEELNAQVTAYRVGKMLKALGYHGDQDKARAHSRVYHGISPTFVREGKLYRYDPDVVLPVLRSVLLHARLEPRAVRGDGLGLSRLLTLVKPPPKRKG